MTIIVCGGRRYLDRLTVYRTLDELEAKCPITLLVEGGQTGADRMAREWAWLCGVPYHTEPADWGRHGPAAGPIRNRNMLHLEPALVVAFPGGRGTMDMVRQARKAGVEVLEVAP
jgi:predicted Rossmann-fold nucleotide-binding protein